jgi:hypothetical protein
MALALPVILAAALAPVPASAQAVAPTVPSASPSACVRRLAELERPPGSIIPAETLAQIRIMGTQATDFATNGNEEACRVRLGQITAILGDYGADDGARSAHVARMQSAVPYVPASDAAPDSLDGKAVWSPGGEWLGEAVRLVLAPQGSATSPQATAVDRPAAGGHEAAAEAGPEQDAAAARVAAQDLAPPGQEAASEAASGQAPQPGPAAMQEASPPGGAPGGWLLVERDAWLGIAAGTVAVPLDRVLVTDDGADLVLPVTRERFAAAPSLPGREGADRPEAIAEGDAFWSAEPRI